jgi:hypothetical protein
VTERDPETLVFDRTPVAKIISCAAVFASASLLFDYLSGAPQDVNALPIIGFSVLWIGTILSALLQYGDHIYFTNEMVMYRNRLLPLLARNGAAMRWEEIVEVREIRKKILVLFSSDGRRLLVDSIGGYAIAKREILRRAAHATVSGTLLPEEVS